VIKHNFDQVNFGQTTPCHEKLDLTDTKIADIILHLSPTIFFFISSISIFLPLCHPLLVLFLLLIFLYHAGFFSPCLSLSHCFFFIFVHFGQFVWFHSLFLTNFNFFFWSRQSTVTCNTWRQWPGVVIGELNFLFLFLFCFFCFFFL
jgi:hypothetical protein